MKFYISFYHTALITAIESENVEILMANKKIDVNIPYILKYF